MSEKRFVVETVEITDCDTDVSRIVKVITDKEECYSYEDLCDIAVLLNEQQATIKKLQDLCGESDSENAKLRQEIKELKAQLREKEEDERLYANEIVKLNKEAKEVLDFKSLGGDY